MFNFWGDWCYKCAGWILQVGSPVASILMVLHRWNQEALVLVSDARRQDLHLVRIKTAWLLPWAVWRGNVHVIACWHVALGKGRDIVRCRCFYLTKSILKRAAWKGRVNSVVCIIRQRPSIVFLLSSASKVLFTCLYQPMEESVDELNCHCWRNGGGVLLTDIDSITSVSCLHFDQY